VKTYKTTIKTFYLKIYHFVAYFKQSLYLAVIIQTK